MVGAVPGLGLQVGASGSRSWILRHSVDGRRRDHGLGPFPEITLTKARESAREARSTLRAGVSPIDAAKAARSAERARQQASKTFAECAAAYIKAHRAAWRNEKHAWQWGASLEKFAFPVIGSLLVGDVTSTHVHEILEPIWTTKHETASRVRGRIENVMDWAIARGYRAGPNPAAWKANLQVMLADPKKVAKVVHHAALAYTDMPAFMASLRAVEGQGARALQFAILCASRSGEVRGATWSEIDLDAATWEIPGERMKMGKPHRVPLSDAAVALLRSTPRVEGTDLVFPSKSGRPLSAMTLTAVTRRMDVDAVPHGFRSSFRTWAAERSSFAREVIEAALAHMIESEVERVERAYQRSDLLDKRRGLMQAWSDFCVAPAAAGKIVHTKKRGAK